MSEAPDDLPEIHCDECKARTPMRQMREVFGRESEFCVGGPVICDRCYARLQSRARAAR